MRARTVLLAAAAFVASLGATVSIAAALGKGDKAPELGVRDVKGRSLQMSDLRGKVVVVDFWASWCKPCKREMPVLDKLYKKYKSKGLVVIGVSVDRDEGKMRKFLEDTSVSFPVAHDADHSVAGRYEPPKMPSSYIIDKRGVVRHVQAGYHAGDAKKMEKVIRSLL